MRKHLISREVSHYKSFFWKYKHVRSAIIKAFSENINIREVKNSSPELKKASGHFYLGKCREAHRTSFQRNAYCAYCVYHVWLFSLTVRHSYGTVLVGIKLEVCCTSVASLVSLFIGVEKKTWPVSHFCDRVDRQLTWLLMLSAPAPWGLPDETSNH